MNGQDYLVEAARLYAENMKAGLPGDMQTHCFALTLAVADLTKTISEQARAPDTGAAERLRGFAVPTDGVYREILLALAELVERKQ
jgi:hypothetical protein